MRIIITGGRKRSAYKGIGDAFDAFVDPIGYLVPKGSTIVEGGCPTGVDHDAARYANEHGFKLESHPANWKQYGRAAGPKRNEQMAASGADLCLAFPSATGSPGTWDMIRRAVAQGIKTIVIPEEATHES